MPHRDGRSRNLCRCAKRGGCGGGRVRTRGCGRAQCGRHHLGQALSGICRSRNRSRSAPLAVSHAVELPRRAADDDCPTKRQHCEYFFDCHPQHPSHSLCRRQRRGKRHEHELGDGARFRRHPCQRRGHRRHRSTAAQSAAQPPTLERARAGLVSGDYRPNRRIQPDEALWQHRRASAGDFVSGIG